ncbi:phosphoribosylanthranilate isomerase [Thiosulfatihalobacter marinus]|uniref:phosphoribosylanthranilate isomerase n=1 Tax=Thiosulfatihalobacter marinus TaxID=2792481 RepID=UPI0018D7DC7D|nr:phosphoribosylanthranilate isomerase [Thiosulfatihalobacter marinus]
MDIRVKICGLKTPEDVAAAVGAGAAYVGFVFFDRSPRCVDVETARALALEVPPGVAKVALVVDAQDAALDEIVGTVPVDMVQLHGAESPERVADIRARYGLPVMKAIGIAGPGDVAQIDRYGAVADQLLVDAKPPRGAQLPGGNGLAFDWRLVNRKYWPCPWMLAGGLTAANVAEAVRMTGARQVDVSSGVERAPGVKDAALIRGFVSAAQVRPVPVLR